jgi:hypothetical protein
MLRECVLIQTLITLANLAQNKTVSIKVRMVDLLSVHATANSYMFLCDQTTEAECLQKWIVGTTQLNAIWCMEIQPGDDIYLFNFNTGVVRGPFAAISRADCHEPTAWGGQFPVQIRIAKTAMTKQADNRAANAPSILKKKRPSGKLGKAGVELFGWLQEVGTNIA